LKFDIPNILLRKSVIKSFSTDRRSIAIGTLLFTNSQTLSLPLHGITNNKYIQIVSYRVTGYELHMLRKLNEYLSTHHLAEKVFISIAKTH